jgi:hypothetical protein
VQGVTNIGWYHMETLSLACRTQKSKQQEELVMEPRSRLKLEARLSNESDKFVVYRLVVRSKLFSIGNAAV